MAVLAFMFQDYVREWGHDLFLQNVKAYREDIDLQNLIDSLQRVVRNTDSSGKATFVVFGLCAWFAWCCIHQRLCLLNRIIAVVPRTLVTGT